MALRRSYWEALAGLLSLCFYDLWPTFGTRISQGVIPAVRGYVMLASPAVQSATHGRSATSPPSEPLRIDRVARAIAVVLPDGRRLSLECWPGDGAPLVLLHGLLDCAVAGSTWRG